MAAITPANLQLNAVITGGYVQAFLAEKFSLQRSGVLEMDNNPPFGSEGQTYTIRQWVRPTVGDSTPTSDTTMTIKALTTTAETGVIVRRGDAYGIERLAALAGGTTTVDWDRNVGNIIGQEVAYNAEYRILYKMVPAIFGASGCLYSTNTVDLGRQFDWSDVGTLNAKFGEAVNSFTAVQMHPNVFWNSNIAAQLTMQPTYADLAAYKAAGIQFMGVVGNLAIFLNERLYTDGTLAAPSGTYYTLFSAPQSLYMGLQLPQEIETYYDPLKAGGTDYVKYLIAYSPRVKGVTWNTTAPTVIGGTTDTLLGTASSWTTKTGYDPKENPIGCIISTI